MGYTKRYTRILTFEPYMTVEGFLGEEEECLISIK